MPLMSCWSGMVASGTPSDEGGKVRSIAFLLSDMDGTLLHPDQRFSP